MPSGLSNVVAITAGEFHNVALLSDGSVQAWGTADPIYAFLTNVPAGLSDVVAIAAGQFHTLALSSDGMVTAWGAGSNNTGAAPPNYGQSMVPTNLSNVVAIAAVDYSSMALESDGTVFIWGELSNSPPWSAGFQGSVLAIGIGPYDNFVVCSGTLPPVIIDQPTGQTQIAGSNVTFTAVALSAGPFTYQWEFDGTNISGATNSSLTLTNVTSAQNGDYQVAVTDASGTNVSSNAAFSILTPPQILSNSPVTPSTNWLATNPTLSVTATGDDTNEFPLFYQWQLNGTNISGATNSVYSPFIVEGNGFGLPLYQVPSSYEGAYSVSISNAAGATNAGPWQIYGFIPGAVAGWGHNSDGQIDRPATLTNVISLAAGEFHSVAVQDDGTVVQWGSPPADVPTNLTNAVAVAASYYHNIALLPDGSVMTWGNSYDSANWVPSNLPPVAAIAAGWNHNEALLTNGTVVAWGANVPIFGTATNVPPDLTNAVAIAAGVFHELAVRSDGTVEAWGYNGEGQTNVPTGLSNVVAVAGGEAHSLALKSDGTVVAWGDNTYGQTNVPAGLSNVMAIAAGDRHSVALLNNGTVVAWGDNTYGETNVPSLPSPVKLIAAGGDFTLAAAYTVVQYYPIDVSRDLLLIYNTNSTDSTTVLNFYLQNRPMVSNANVLGIGFEGFPTTNATAFAPSGYYYTNATTYESIYAPDLTNLILAPITNWLNTNPTKRPEYVILFLDVPSRSSTVAISDDTFPYQGEDVPSVSVQISTYVQGWQPLVTHINMDGTNDCIAYIRKIASFGSNNSPGKLVVSASTGGYANTNYCLDNMRDTNSYLGLGGIIADATNAIISDSSSPFSITYTDIGQGAITNATNVAAYVSWGSHSSYFTNYTWPIDTEVVFSNDSGWYPMYTLESYNGRRYWYGQYMSSFVMWFAPDAFGGSDYSRTPLGAMTHVNEPGGSGISDVSTYFGLWSAGNDFAVCAWSSRNTPYFQVVGDPFLTK